MEARPAPFSTRALDLEDLLDELRARASDARDSQERLAGLLDAVVAISTDLELSEVLQRIVEAACTLVSARYGALGVLGAGGDGLSTFTSHGLTAQQREAITQPPRGRGVLAALRRDRKPLRLREVTDHPASVGFPAGHPPMHSFLGVPILIRDQVFGNLYLADKRGAPEFSAEDESILVALAAGAGVAIENAQLFERTKQQRVLSEAITDLSRMLLESEEEHSALETLVRHAAGCGCAPFVAIALVDDAGDLVVRATHTGDEAPLAVRDAMPVGVALAGPRWQDARQTDEPLLIARLDDPDGDALSREGPVALIPVAVGGERLGVLLFAWTSAVPGTSRDTLAALGGFAQQGALALLAGRAQRDRSRMALLEDRDRIARDMHDHVIQRLFATGLSLQSAARLAQHPLVRARLDNAVDELDESIREIRRTIFELHRPIPSAGLREQLRTLVDSTSAVLGFAPSLTIDGSLAGLSGSLEADIVAVVREALSNIARHAAAASAGVEIAAGDTITITVVDDGVGMDPGGARSGLVNLGSRAAGRSGRFEVRRGESGGTLLRWRVPREVR